MARPSILYLAFKPSPTPSLLLACPTTAINPLISCILYIQHIIQNTALVNEGHPWIIHHSKCATRTLVVFHVLSLHGKPGNTIYLLPKQSSIKSYYGSHSKSVRPTTSTNIHWPWSHISMMSYEAYLPKEQGFTFYLLEHYSYIHIHLIHSACTLVRRR